MVRHGVSWGIKKRMSDARCWCKFIMNYEYELGRLSYVGCSSQDQDWKGFQSREVYHIIIKVRYSRTVVFFARLQL